MSLDQPKKFASFDQGILSNLKRKQIEEYFVPHHPLFFNLQNNIKPIPTINDKNEVKQTIINPDFLKHFESKKKEFLETNTDTFKNIIKYFQNIHKCPGIVYCLSNLPKNAQTNESDKYHSFVENLRKKIEDINPAIVYNFFVEYFINKKNEYINTKDGTEDDQPKPLNYIENTNPNYAKIPGAEVQIKISEDKTKTVKVTNIVLHNLTNIIGHKATFFSGYDFGLYQKGTEKYNDFLKNFSCIIIIIKMFFDEKNKLNNILQKKSS